MGERSSGFTQALADLAGALAPLSLRRLQARLEERLAKIPNRINEYGYDAYGFSPDWVRRSLLPSILLYRYYFRCQVVDIDRLPRGRMLLVANHAGQLPIDGMVLSAALLMDAEPPRIARAMGEYFIPRLPFLAIAFSRGGAMVGTPENCVHMLENEECVMVFPEGARGISKPFSRRYQLQRFGLGFMRLALETQTPVVPVGIVGSEEQMPGLFNLESLARLLDLPAIPITPTFPLLGPLGLLPLPSRYRITFGAPMHFQGDAGDEDAAIEARVAEVKQAVDGLLQRGLAERSGVFR